MAITTRNKLRTVAWAADVQVLESAIARFDTSRHSTSECQVVFFEIAHDNLLHVNVTHPYLTRGATGWIGPASMPEGFVHNRRFAVTPQRQMIRAIRSMVFSPRM